MFVTVNFQVACVGTDSASILKLQQPLLAGVTSFKVVCNVSARNWAIRV